MTFGDQIAFASEDTQQTACTAECKTKSFLAISKPFRFLFASRFAMMFLAPLVHFSVCVAGDPTSLVAEQDASTTKIASKKSNQLERLAIFT